MTISSILSAHHDAVAASILGGVAGAAHVAGVVPMPADSPAWLGWLGALGVGLAPLLVSRLLAGAAAFPRALAAERERVGRELLNDADAGNDARGAQLLDEAAKLRALASAIDAAGNKRGDKGGEA